MRRAPLPGPGRADTLRRWRGAARRAAAVLLILLLIPGCSSSGNGRVLFTALNFQAVDPPAGPPPTITELNLDGAFWWTDAQNRVWIALEHTYTSLLAPQWPLRFLLSFRLEEPPAGRARDYVLGRQELRATARFGPAYIRFVSVAGVVALYREPGDRLRGSFRLDTAREVQGLLGSWGRPARYLLLGTFDAVHDPARGQAIADQTETVGRERDPQVTGDTPP